MLRCSEEKRERRLTYMKEFGNFWFWAICTAILSFTKFWLYLGIPGVGPK